MVQRIFTRVAAVQIAYHPAIVLDSGTPLENPLFDLEHDTPLLLMRDLPASLTKEFTELRARIRSVYLEGLRRKLLAILRACAAWDVHIVVFPEYSIPWQLLGEVAGASGSMVVVAGTHTVEHAACDSAIYTHLGAETPPLFHAVCPVLHQGRLIALQPKLHPPRPEEGQRLAGDAWRPVPLPDGRLGPMGVLAGLDFLHRAVATPRAICEKELAGARFLAVPSLMPWRAPSENSLAVWEAAHRDGRPVLFANTAGSGAQQGGGTSIFVDERPPPAVLHFPEHPGSLRAGEEGVIVADVDLGFVRSHEQTGSDRQPPVRPYAAASLAYSHHPAGRAYVDWLSGELLKRADEEAVRMLSAKVSATETLLLDAAALGGATRARRLQQLVRSHAQLTTTEEFRRLTREIVLPAGDLPLQTLNAAMSGAASDAIFEWMKLPQNRSAGLSETLQRLQAAAAQLGPIEPETWTPEGRKELAAIRTAVRGQLLGPSIPRVELEPVPSAAIKGGLDPAALGTRRRDNLVLRFSPRFEDFAVWQNLIKFTDDKNQRVSAERSGNTGGLTIFARLLEAMLGRGYPSGAVIIARQLLRLVTAEGRLPASALVVESRTDESVGLAAVSYHGKHSGWKLSHDPEEGFWKKQGAAVRRALEAEGLRPLAIVAPSQQERAARIEKLLVHFRPTTDAIAKRRSAILRGTGQHFIDLTCIVDGKAMPALAALDAWLAGSARTVILLGAPGSGKTTLLIEWCSRIAVQPHRPQPVLIPLLSVGREHDAVAMALSAVPLDDTAQHRAALMLLTEARLLLLCFDGLDEIDASDADRANRLREFLRVAESNGKVVVSSRIVGFPMEADPRSGHPAALSEERGAASDPVKLVLQPLAAEQIKEMIRRSFVDANMAGQALRRITYSHDLSTLAQSPVLLGLTLKTLGNLELDVRTAPADLFDAFLLRQLDRIGEDSKSPARAQRLRFYEALAEQLWRTGEVSCGLDELHYAVRDRLDELPLAQVPLEHSHGLQSDSIIVRDEADRYRFVHKSLGAYFLARALLATLAERPLDALCTRPLTDEVIDFLSGILRRQGAWRESAAIRAVQSWLVEDRELRSASRSSQEAEAAAVNALRLLLGLQRSFGESEGTIPDGADLRELSLFEADLRSASLRKARLQGADLSRADLRHADLREADLTGARLVSVILDGATLHHANLHNADLLMAAADRASLFGADLQQSNLAQSVWTHCDWDEAALDDAELTAAILVGNQAPTPPAEIGPTLAPSAAKLTLAYELPDEPSDIAWSADGRWLAIGSKDGILSFWDVGAATCKMTLHGHGESVRAIAFSPDKRTVAVGAQGHTVRLWDASSGRFLRTLEGPGDWVTVVAFAPDGRTLAAGSFDHSVHVWEVASGRLLHTLKGPKDWIAALAFGPDGHTLASCSGSSSVQIWEMQHGQILRTLQGPANSVAAASFGPNGRILASSAGDNAVHVWETQHGRILHTLRGHAGLVVSLSFSPDGRTLASGSYDSTVRLWEVPNGLLLHSLEGHSSSVSATAFNSDGRTLASMGFSDGTVRVWEIQSGRLLRTLESHAKLVSSSGSPLVMNYDYVDGQVALSAAGYCHLIGPEELAHRLRLSVQAPGDGNGQIYLPLGGLRAALEKRARIEESLAGRPPSAEQLTADLTAAGFFGGVPWDGERHFAEAARRPFRPPLSVAKGGEERLNLFRPGGGFDSRSALLGREPKLDELLSLLEGRCPAVVLGPRRSGKTWLLHLIAQRLGKARPVYYVTLEGKQLVTADDLAEALDPGLLEEAPRPAESRRRSSSQRFRERWQSGPRPVFLIDEVAHLHRANGMLFPWLRALGQEFAGLILAGSQLDWVKVVERAVEVAPGSSFGNDVTRVTLGPIAEREAERFLSDTSNNVIPPTAARRVVKMCGPWPYYLQVMGYALFERARAGDHRPLIDSYELRTLYEQRLLESDSFKSRWADLVPEVRELLLQHPEPNERPDFMKLPKVDRIHLVNTGLCTATGVWLADRPFFEWIYANRAILSTGKKESS